MSSTAAASGVSLALIASNGIQPFQSALGFALLGYLATTAMIPRAIPVFIKRGLCGKDMSKTGKPVIAETMGAIPAACYLLLMILFIPFMYIRYYDTTSEASNLFPNGKLSSFLGGMLCLESMVLLGLTDDLFDIRWRHKFFLPAIAAIPMLVIYYVDFGITSVLIPNFAKAWLGLDSNSVNLGGFYYVYMGCVCIFCPNSVNILAGINGLEVGQTVVIGFLLLLNDGYYLGTVATDSPAHAVHLYSICMLIPFLGVSLGLLKYNWYPSRVFVGDTWCYFSGMVFAVVGISGHFAKTLMLFFVPQIFNFIYSAPQLFGIIPCPRHRLPHFNEKDGLMYNSYTEYDKPISPELVVVFLVLEKLRLIKLQRAKDGHITKSSNLTLINLTIIWFGPMREDHLCTVILVLQLVTGLSMLVLRHTVAPLIFGFDNSKAMVSRYDQ